MHRDLLANEALKCRAIQGWRRLRRSIYLIRWQLSLGVN
jgi:hypothetical protein